MTRKNEISASWDTESNGGLELEQVAICKMYFRQQPNHWFRTDLGMHLVRNGLATTSNNDDMAEDANVVHVETSSKVRHLHQDVRYMEELQRLEYQAVQESKGMWSFEWIRKRHKDLLTEVEIRNAPLYQRVWQWIRERIF
eukprot:CAMPEP_0116846958 /NCGR_PEP_ID=MMETSP0418-20121206/14156_1 /TAXON_ID=1158023 /ORGANISM="Astrosyne radiata, Strain 13vi08-1A" /LENGTH=140 /DNA_ID=CAMNT_0004478327 /DNA_START=55 /DNA_END=477 /DNA_ORIENTATION=+